MQGPFFLIWRNYASPVAQFRETHEGNVSSVEILIRKNNRKPYPKNRVPRDCAHVHNARHVLYTDLAVGEASHVLIPLHTTAAEALFVFLGI